MTAMTHQYLSPAWMEAAVQVRDRYRDSFRPVEHAVRVNQIVTGAPFGGDGLVETHVDTSSGELDIDLGLLEEPDATLTLSYETARTLFFSGRPQTFALAVASGELRIEGDVLKMLVALHVDPDPVELEVTELVRAITH